MKKLLYSHFCPENDYEKVVIKTKNTKKNSMKRKKNILKKFKKKTVLGLFVYEISFDPFVLR